MNIDFFKKHIELFTILGLLVAFYFLFFHNIWAYALLDVDETRYVDMSRVMFKTKNFLTLYLNGDYFFEKPPLYFWIENLSFAIFNKVTEWSARIPIAIEAIIPCFVLYFTGKKIISRKFGVFAALILATSLEYQILAKIAILDMLLTTCITLSVFAGFMTFFENDKNKKYFWWAMYLFSGFAVMAKGIPGFVVPFGIMFFAGIVSGKFKEYFRPQYFIPGILLFLLIAMPWHVVMLKLHDPLFFNEYVMKHHLARFMGGDVIGRTQPWYFYLLMLLWGLLPWIGSFIALITEKIMKIKFFKWQKFNEMTTQNQFLVLNLIGLVFTLLFFSSSGTKLVTYILPLYPFLAVILADYWLQYTDKNEHSKPIAISAYILNSIFIIAGIAAIFVKFFLPAQLMSDIQEVQLLVIFLFAIIPAAGLFALKKDKKIYLFASYILFMVILSAFGTHKIFNIDYKFGQNDLIEYGKYAQETGSALGTFDFGRRYSLMYYSKSKVNFQGEENYEWLNEHLKKPKMLIVVKNKKMPDLNGKASFEIIKQGRKYTLIKNKN